MTREIFSLCDNQWQFASVAQKSFTDHANDIGTAREWVPAQIPGDVRLDLLRAGKISDPFIAENNEQSQWIDARDWWYTRAFELQIERGARAFLIFEGIDYQSAVFVNDQPLGRHAGMFSRQVYEITDIRRPRSDNFQFAIRVWGADALPKMQLAFTKKIWKQLIRPLIAPPNEPFPDRFATLKCQMQFGWDFAPRLRACGIWDDAFVVITRTVFIEDAFIQSQVSDQKSRARVIARCTLDSDREQSARISCLIREKKSRAQILTNSQTRALARGKQVIAIEMEIENPRVWNPWDRGEPNLSELEIQIESQDGEPFDSISETFGIRALELGPIAARKNSEPWTFVLNGAREFLRGANWVPLDAIPARVMRADYETRLKQARAANINFLRVWGGGLKEKRAFYDLCDELGILVWQEFPFAGAVVDQFPSDTAHLNFVRAECGAIVRALRNHPSLVAWCGGNEFNSRANRAIVSTLREIISDEDGTRPFKPASPYRDESHNWRVWHRGANLRDYSKDQSPFLSEFGLQAAPEVESLKKFLPTAALFPPNRLWEYHHAELKKLFRYARSVIAKQSPSFMETLAPHASAGVASSQGVYPERSEGLLAMTTESFVDATQRAQAHAIQIAVEHVRRRKGKSAGVAVWQLNDPWPNISWSVIDYFGIPKRAYRALARVYAPVLASFEYALAPRRAGDRVTGALWIVNDYLRAGAFELRARHNGREIFARRFEIAADSSARVGELEICLDNGANILQLVLCQGAEIISENEYDLNFCDVGEINPLSALLVTVVNRLMR